MNKKQAKNLYKCVRALKESPNPKAFDMSKYIHEINDYDQIDEVIEILENNWCGTPACVYGHFASRSDLQKIIKVKVIKNKKSKIFNMYDVTKKHYEKEILKYFGITVEEADDLFSSNGCNNAKTTKEAIRYIENFLIDKGFTIRDLA